jgi:hypothetical protein
MPWAMPLYAAVTNVFSCVSSDVEKVVAKSGDHLMEATTVEAPRLCLLAASAWASERPSEPP